MLIYVF